MPGYWRDPKTGLVTFCTNPLYTIKVKTERKDDLLALFRRLGRSIERSSRTSPDLFVVDFYSSMSPPEVERMIRDGLEGGDGMFLEIDCSRTSPRI